MPDATDSHPQEADERTAPFVFLYIAVVLAGIAALIAWVFWYRGYA